jgi:hypothetical protein
VWDFVGTLGIGSHRTSRLTPSKSRRAPGLTSRGGGDDRNRRGHVGLSRLLGDRSRGRNGRACRPRQSPNQVLVACRLTPSWTATRAGRDALGEDDSGLLVALLESFSPHSERSGNSRDRVG